MNVAKIRFRLAVNYDTTYSSQICFQRYRSIFFICWEILYYILVVDYSLSLHDDYHMGRLFFSSNWLGQTYILKNEVVSESKVKCLSLKIKCDALCLF